MIDTSRQSSIERGQKSVVRLIHSQLKGSSNEKHITENPRGRVLLELWDPMLWDMAHRMIVILVLATQKRNDVWLVLEWCLSLDDRDIRAV